jgi:hypothetical protein
MKWDITAMKKKRVNSGKEGGLEVTAKKKSNCMLARMYAYAN